MLTCGCTERKVYAKGLCQPCYQKARRQKYVEISQPKLTHGNTDPAVLQLIADLTNRVILLENKDKEATGEPWANRLYKGTPFERKIIIYGKGDTVGKEVKYDLPTIPLEKSTT